MSKEAPEPLDFFIWTVQDVGLWLEEINLGSYRQIFIESGVNGEYLEGMSMFTTDQILRFIRRCHMKWGDFITLCKELRRIKDMPRRIVVSIVEFLFPTPKYLLSGLPKRGTESTAALVGSMLPLYSICQGCEEKQALEARFVEAGTLMINLVI